MQQALERVRREILERRAVLHAGIVDEDVDGPDVGLEAVDGRTGRGVISGIEGERSRAGNGARGSRKLGLVATVENDLRTGLGQAARKRKADTLRRSCHQRSASCQIEQVDCHPVSFSCGSTYHSHYTMLSIT